MVTYLLNDTCLAAIVQDEELENIRPLIRCCLSSAGLGHWEETSVDVFSLNGCSLLLARPLSPLPQKPRRYRYKK